MVTLKQEIRSSGDLWIKKNSKEAVEKEKLIMKEFFKENGHPSMIRLLSFIATILAAVICIFILILSAGAKPVVLNNTFIPADVTVIRELIYLAGTLLMFAFGGKAVQKYAEREISHESGGKD